MNAKQTPLYDWHVDYGAKMVLFHGYEMPLWYRSGAKKEHLAVLTDCGLFDTCHMSVIRLSGPHIFEVLQWCFSRDLSRCIGRKGKPLTPGKSSYGVFLDDRGFVIDDGILFQCNPDEYLAVVNAGMGSIISQHILNCSFRSEKRYNIIVKDLTGKVGKIDVQGPLSAKIIREVISSPDRVFQDLHYFSFKGSFFEKTPYTGEVCLLNSTRMMLSRTGYTGELGFELFLDQEHIIEAWELILHAGRKYGIKPCGLAARDSLRVGAVLPLSHRDIGNWKFVNNPWLIALPLSFDKKEFTKDFLGKEALENSSSDSFTYPFLGFDVRKVNTTNTPPEVIDNSGKRIGIVLTCINEMSIGYYDGKVYSINSPDKPKDFVLTGLCCGFIKVNIKLSEGEIVKLRDSSREIQVVIKKDIRPDRTARRPLN